MERDDKRLRFLPLEEAIVPPPGLIEHLKDRWWCADSRRGLIYYAPHGPDDPGVPQCNTNETITRSICGRLYPWAELIFLPSVFHRINPSDYGDN